MINIMRIPNINYENPDPVYREVLNENIIYDYYNEASDESSDKHLETALLDIDDFVKKNDVKQISNPLLFLRENYPTPDGLLSNEIFGITRESRANIYGYIALNGVFMQPLCYKAWVSIDSRIRNIAHGVKKYIITESGELEENENGKTGIKFLKDNFDKIKIKSTGSTKRDNKIKFLKAHKNVMFINKYLVIPPFYRDSNTSKNNASVEGVNKLYISLIIAANTLKETAEFGFSMEGAQQGRVQEMILNIYDYFCGNNNTNIEDSVGLARKEGIIRKAVLSKTTDYGSRNVLSAPDLKVENLGDMMADMKHAVIPLSTAITTFYPYVLFVIRRYFDNWFNDVYTMEYIDDSNNTVSQIRVRDPYVQFNDDRIKDEIKKFLHGYSNRITPLTVEAEDLKGNPLKKPIYLRFKGYRKLHAKDDENQLSDDIDELNSDEENTTENEMTPPEEENIIIDSDSIINRKVTWLDIFYLAACEATEDKTVFITRFPINKSVGYARNSIENTCLKAGNS